jgi:hypothetical protein
LQKINLPGQNHFFSFGKVQKLQTSNMASSSSIRSLGKQEKYSRRLENARLLGTSSTSLYPDLVPQAVQLKKAALERKKDLLCHSWTRSRLVEWLEANPPLP